jgi:hypothetical protein
MKSTYFNTEEDYYQFIKNWKQFVKSGKTKDRPYVFLIHNILKGREPFYGFSENTKCHCYYVIDLSLTYDRIRFDRQDDRSCLYHLLQNVNLDRATLINDLGQLCQQSLLKARAINALI